MIKLFNTLNKVQSVKIKDRFNNYYDMFIESRRSVGLEVYQITEDIKAKVSKGDLLVIGDRLISTEVKGSHKSSVVVDTIKVEPVDQSKSIDTDPLPEVIETSVEDIKADAVKLEETKSEEVSKESETTSEFVCEICGSEFASKRGLDMHKSRSHSNK